MKKVAYFLPCLPPIAAMAMAGAGILSPKPGREIVFWIGLSLIAVAPAAFGLYRSPKKAIIYLTYLALAGYAWGGPISPANPHTSRYSPHFLSESAFLFASNGWRSATTSSTTPSSTNPPEIQTRGSYIASDDSNAIIELLERQNRLHIGVGIINLLAFGLWAWNRSSKRRPR